MSLKINRLLPMTTINMLMKFEIEIPKQTWLMLRKPCRLQTDGRTNGQMEKVNPVYPPPPSNFVGRGYNNLVFHIKWKTPSYHGWPVLQKSIGPGNTKDVMGRTWFCLRKMDDRADRMADGQNETRVSQFTFVERRNQTQIMNQSWHSEKEAPSYN